MDSRLRWYARRKSGTQSGRCLILQDAQYSHQGLTRRLMASYIWLYTLTSIAPNRTSRGKASNSWCGASSCPFVNTRSFSANNEITKLCCCMNPGMVWLIHISTAGPRRWTCFKVQAICFRKLRACRADTNRFGGTLFRCDWSLFSWSRRTAVRTGGLFCPAWGVNFLKLSILQNERLSILLALISSCPTSAWRPFAQPFRQRRILEFSAGPLSDDGPCAPFLVFDHSEF